MDAPDARGGDAKGLAQTTWKPSRMAGAMPASADATGVAPASSDVGHQNQRSCSSAWLVRTADLEGRPPDISLPRRFRSSVAGAPCGPGRLALELPWLRKAQAWHYQQKIELGTMAG